MTLLEWGALPASVLAPVYRREQERWLSTLQWDAADSWETIETGRVTWGLPGLVCRDPDGRIRGWTFYIERDRRVQVGGFVADTADTTALLLDGLQARIGAASELTGFFYSDAPGLEAALAGHGIDVERYVYQMRDTAGQHRPASAVHDVSGGRAPAGAPCVWAEADAADAALLLRAAYGASGAMFAPGNAPEAWRDYVDALVAHTGCGVLAPDLSRVIRVDGQLRALALVTTIAPRTAHLAQLAVDPGLRRSGLARSLLEEVLRVSRSAGYRYLSLLVSERNQAAGALYREAGFVARGHFLGLSRRAAS